MSSIFTVSCEREASVDEVTQLAIGRFDGVHLGHKELISLLGKSGAVLLIDTHQSPYLTTIAERISLIEKSVYVLDINRIKDLDGGEFVAILQKEFKSLKQIVVGYDFRFGKSRTSGVNELMELFDGETLVVPEFRLDGFSVHSALIRSMLFRADVSEARRLLGRAYGVCADVIRGQGLGHKELFATINLSTSSYVLPKDGVYATRTILGTQYYDSVSFLGHRASTDGRYAFETHVLFRDLGEISGRVRVEFIKHIRDNFKFPSLAELKKQIELDIKTAGEILC
ncbi:bifunctional riboflavin kinase/FAD synthetase [Campylobacter sp. 19-13652]|uniref:bifunctional riboflavin kinase/FAD synthetase n=1 Tax=Campylobacter sp. 19-13652 TaxID=2840180 RepID=UPI001C780E5F|nr:bifunctional riboflavin kinase/FAD synthetase [Campylobacter sp. 19-13652]BCX79658.1 riboflavin biosynthesis protein [Campylobacter sp. 19-13652]